MRLSLLTVSPSNATNKYPGIFGLIKFRWLKTHNPLNSKKYSGSLLFLKGVLAFLGIITAETLYPGYSTAQNMISDLRATEPPNSIIMQPSSTIFGATMAISGLLIIASAYCIQHAFGDRAVTASLGLLGTYVLGVGIFNGSYGDIHGIFALIAFVAGGVAAIASSRIERAQMNYFSVVLVSRQSSRIEQFWIVVTDFIRHFTVDATLGGIALLDLLLYFFMGEASPFATLGPGGLERWIAYPILLWVTGFGGYLMGHSRT
ncbi:DUF998 domain-containing protein [Methanosarcina sp. Mfa9]|uniref:DUF998 domain-containing protein n=1 Tax=Methanosarcina sp. Mfa9 TaxID=3439063 RepID=UPI003F87A2D0